MGNAIDFGDLSQTRGYTSACASATRGSWFGGTTPSYVNTIDYVTIMSTGNAIDFGDLTITVQQGGACSNGHGGLG